MKSKKRAIKVKWKKRKGVSGYRIDVYDASTYNWKRVKRYYATNYKKTSHTFKGLKDDRWYYAKVYTYKKSKGQKVYSIKAGEGLMCTK